MRLLLDSNALIWMVYAPERLSAKARAALQSEANELWVSDAAIWEISNKMRRGRLPNAGSSVMYILAEMEVRGVNRLPIELSHILAGEDLPFHHSDPFDRMMIAQGQIEEMTLVSADGEFAKYSAKLLW
jgi:PIN domain nuclease of toxin-antitoxin system